MSTCRALIPTRRVVQLFGPLALGGLAACGSAAPYVVTSPAPLSWSEELPPDALSSLRSGLEQFATQAGYAVSAPTAVSSRMREYGMVLRDTSGVVLYADREYGGDMSCWGCKHVDCLFVLYTGGDSGRPYPHFEIHSMTLVKGLLKSDWEPTGASEEARATADGLSQLIIDADKPADIAAGR